MRNAQVVLYVLGALLTLYLVAATWRSQEAAARRGEDCRQWRLRMSRLKQRIATWRWAHERSDDS